MQAMGKRTQIKDFLSDKDSCSIGFVPTMGALHAGHISLVERARKECATVVVSIFVNPTQFNDKNDLKSYPRMIEQDLKLLEAAGVDVVFTPTEQEIYPEPDTRQFDFGQIDKVMEGSSRPGHFNGVAQVVSRLFDIVKPTKAYFGEKDFQQIAIIKDMIHQLDYPTQIVPCQIIRNPDGLALSSRNMLLTPEHRDAAPLIYAALKEGVEMSNKMSVEQVTDHVINKINANSLLEVVYFHIVNSDTMQPVHNWSDDCAKQGCITVQAGSVRLIDNIRFV